MGKIVPIVVTGINEGVSTFRNHATAPVVKYVNDEDLKIFGPIAPGGSSRIVEHKIGGKQYAYTTPIKPEDFEVLRNPATTDYALVGRKTIGGSANNTTQSTTTILRRYTEITTATGGSADACKLPAAPAVGDVYCLINNHATVTLQVFPGTGGTINGGAANAKIDVAPGARVFFVCTAANTWKTAIDHGR